MRTLFLMLLVCSPALAQTLTVKGATNKDAAAVVVRAKVKDKKLKGAGAEGVGYTAEFATPGLTDAKDETEYFTFLMKAVPANSSHALKLVSGTGPMSLDLSTAMKYQIVEKDNEFVDVVQHGKTLVRFINKKRDEKDHYLTFKPFHQVFAPSWGKLEKEINLTSGAQPKTAEFVFPHHRGIFYGFNKITYGDKLTADIWHGEKNVYSQCDKITKDKLFGDAFGRYTAAISWHGSDGATFAEELRETTVYNITDEVKFMEDTDKLSAATMIDLVSVLSTKLDKVKLDGDPQHAGLHFRAAQVVAQKIEAEKAAAKKENRSVKLPDTYYLRPDGQGKPGEYRNWDPKTKEPKTINVPWNACSFVTQGKRYTVLRMSHPDNPKDSRGSERDYARFGDYFEYELTPKTPLKVQYRFYIQPGEMTKDQCEALYNGYTLKLDVAVSE
jgi:Methane oxygenase PmoA